MYALHEEKSRIKYIHVRHEEVGALAAVADGKLTGHIGVAFGSAGPGATHLFQGAYDAKMDKVPTLFLVGQVEQRFMNADFFQELDEDPMFQDAAVYARTVTTAHSILGDIPDINRKNCIIGRNAVDLAKYRLKAHIASGPLHHVIIVLMPIFDVIDIGLIPAAARSLITVGNHFLQSCGCIR